MMRRRVVVMVWAALLIGQSSCSRQSRAYKEFLPPVVRPQQEQVTIRFQLIFGDTVFKNKPKMIIIKSL